MAKLFRLLIFIALSSSTAAFASFGDQSFSHCQEPNQNQTSVPDAGFSIESLFAGALSDGQILWPLILALLAGFLTSLSPCVYPLIPITLSIMGARKYESHLHGFLVAGSYVLGMSTVYTALGALFASLGIVVGSLMQSEVVLILFALLFFFMSLAMLGIFEFTLPPTLLKRFSRIGGRGFKGAFLMGLVAGVIAAPCTGPVLGAILALIAQNQNLSFGILLMGSFSLGLGLPFLALGAFSSTVSHLPKSGAWMNTIKYLLGAITLGMGLYFLVQVLAPLQEIFFKIANIHNLGVFAITAVGILIIACASQIKFWRAIGVILCSVGFATLLYTQAPEAKSAHVSTDKINWHIINAQTKDPKIFDQLLVSAQQSCLPVLIDFYADWCIACRELSSITFVDSAVKARLTQFFLIKIDASENSQLLSTLHKRYNITGLPTLVILDRSGQERPSSRIMGFMKAGRFLKALMSY